MKASTAAARRAHEAAIMAIAARQHGVVTRAQLLEVGLAPRTVVRRVAAQRVRELHRGVYLVGPLLTDHARAMAAVLACGTGAVVSHCSAALLWRLLTLAKGWEAVDVIVRHGDHRRPGIRTHRVLALPRDEITRLEGVPVTRPARTLIDLAGAVTVRELERALGRALTQDLTGSTEISKLVTRHARRPGVVQLRALVAAPRAAATRSEAERRFLALIDQTGIDAPEVNVDVAGHEVDFFWRRERLVVEVDGFAYHSSAHRFERDRRRDAELLAHGVRVLRVTWRQLTKEPNAVLVRLAQALARTGG